MKTESVIRVAHARLAAACSKPIFLHTDRICAGGVTTPPRQTENGCPETTEEEST